MSIGDRIKSLRQEKGISQTNMAIDIGVSKQTLYKYENNLIVNIPTDKIEAIAQRLHTSPSYLMGWDTDFDFYEDPNIKKRDDELDSISDFLECHSYYLDCENYDDPVFTILKKNDSNFFISVSVSTLLNTYEELTCKSKMNIDDFITQLSLPSKQEVCKIPVLGRVAAGIPLDAIEEIIDYEEIPPKMAADGEYFALQIKGDSMEPKISNGDIVIVRKQSTAADGDIVIALINGDDAVCKRLKIYQDGIALISSNPTYEPLYFSNEDIEKKPVQILGEVKELRAKF